MFINLLYSIKIANLLLTDLIEADLSFRRTLSRVDSTGLALLPSIRCLSYCLNVDLSIEFARVYTDSSAQAQTGLLLAY